MTASLKVVLCQTNTRDPRRKKNPSDRVTVATVTVAETCLKDH